jgi:hypothetical protein
MGTSSRLDEDATLAAMAEAETMAAVLEGRHGVWAADVADFFAAFHKLKGDQRRSWAWSDVADVTRRRAEERQNEH